MKKAQKSKSQKRRQSVMNTGLLPSHCVQCGKPMAYGTDNGRFIPVCDNPECGNYGLLQIGIEAMTKLENEKNLS